MIKKTKVRMQINLDAEESKTSEIYSNDFTDSILKGTFEDYAFGCILGAFTGDSCGSFNEFCEYV